MMVNKSENRKKEIELLQTAPDLTAIVCDSTRLPYVECDIETCDDQVLVYENREMAEKLFVSPHRQTSLQLTNM